MSMIDYFYYRKGIENAKASGWVTTKGVENYVRFEFADAEGNTQNDFYDYNRINPLTKLVFKV